MGFHLKCRDCGRWTLDKSGYLNNSAVSVAVCDPLSGVSVVLDTL